MMCLRVHRIIKNYFGNYRNFVAWCTAVALAVYTIDSLITPKIAHPRMTHVSTEATDLTLRTMAASIDFGEEDKEDKSLPSKKSSEHAVHCGLATACPRGKYSYYVRSGYGRDTSATICFNENYIVAEDKISSDRGLNMVVINDATMNVEEIKVFDVYTSDASLISYLRNDIKEKHLIFVTSHDEASFNLSSVARREFYKFGSEVLDRVNFRDNYAIIGQKGAAKGDAIEDLQARKEEMQFAEHVTISGCMTIPLSSTKKQEKKKPAESEKELKKPVEAPRGPLPDQVVKKPEVKKPVETKPANEAKKKEEVKKPAVKPEKKEDILEKFSEEKRKEVEKKSSFQMGQESMNCGVKESCAKGEFPVHLYSGINAKELPKICVNGKYVMTEGINDPGRGLNFAVVDSKTHEVTRVARFDTYGSDDNAIELFLEMLSEGDIILGVAHDEATNKLEKAVRDLLIGLGSSFINTLSFRDVWAFVGQKGIVGFTPYEEFEFSDADTERHVLSWPVPIDKRYCVSSTIKALPKKRILVKNQVRKDFCKKHDGYGDFCSRQNVAELLLPTALVDKSLANDPIFTIPIAIVAGLEYNSLRRQLDGLFANPGIKIDKIVVFYDEKFGEAGELATVFNVSSHKLDSSIKYTELMDKALTVIWKLFPNTKHVIMLEEEVFPTTDFLSFFRQCLPAVEADKTLAGISAWNDNAYYSRASLRNIAYRAEVLPGLGFLLKKSFYEEQIKDKMAKCCMRRSWEGWIRDDMGDFEMVIPDISRVERGQYNGRMTDLLKELYRRPRESSGFDGVQHKVTNADSLLSSKYEANLDQVIGKTGSLNTTMLQMCLTGKDFIYPVNTIKKGSYAVYYEQETKADEKLLYELCKCFNLFHVSGYKARGTHRGLMRFSHGDSMVFLIGSKSKYYSKKPDSVKPLLLSKTR